MEWCVISSNQITKSSWQRCASDVRHVLGAGPCRCHTCLLSQRITWADVTQDVWHVCMQNPDATFKTPLRQNPAESNQPNWKLKRCFPRCFPHAPVTWESFSLVITVPSDLYNLLLGESDSAELTVLVLSVFISPSPKTAQTNKLQQIKPRVKSAAPTDTSS